MQLAEHVREITTERLVRVQRRLRLGRVSDVLRGLLLLGPGARLPQGVRVRRRMELQERVRLRADRLRLQGRKESPRRVAVLRRKLQHRERGVSDRVQRSRRLVGNRDHAEARCGSARTESAWRLVHEGIRMHAVLVRVQQRIDLQQQQALREQDLRDAGGDVRLHLHEQRWMVRPVTTRGSA